MHNSHRHRWLLLLACAAALFVGCAKLRDRSWWPIGGPTSDRVPGVVSPVERKERIRALAKQARRAAPADVERIAGELAAQFRSEDDPLMRAEIVRGLANLRTTTAGDVLRTAIGDPDTDVRIAACHALSRFGGPDAISLLSQASAADVDIDVRLAAVRALGQTKDPAAVAALGRALDDRDPALQYYAVHSLQEVTRENLGNNVDRWRQYVQSGQVPSERPVSVVERLRQQF